MNITVSHEELRDYQRRMSEWFIKRLAAAQEMKMHDDPFGREGTRLHWKQPLGEWVKQNPMPTLIPTDL